MTTNNSGGADSYSSNSTRWSRGYDAGHRAEQGQISEDEDREVSKFIPSRTRGESMASWAGQPSIRGSTESMRMALLTVTAVGLQYVSPYPLTVLVLISFVQTYMGNGDDLYGHNGIIYEHS
jgi:hypothetical protein